MTDSHYLNEFGEVVVDLLPDDLRALMLAQIDRNNGLLVTWREGEGNTLEFDSFAVYLSWSRYVSDQEIFH
jgi:hypothetical protein